MYLASQSAVVIPGYVDPVGPCDSGCTGTDRPSPSPFEVVRSVAATSPPRSAGGATLAGLTQRWHVSFPSG
jgi:hypothetical protein